MSKVSGQNETRTTHRSNERAAAERTSDAGHHHASRTERTEGGHEAHQHVDQGDSAHHSRHAHGAEMADAAGDTADTQQSAAAHYKYKEGFATGDAKDNSKADTSDKTGWQKHNDLTASGTDEADSGADQGQAWKQIPTTDLVKKIMGAPPAELQELGKKLYESLAAGKEGAKELFNPHEDDGKGAAAGAKAADTSAAQSAKDAKTQAKYTALGNEDQDTTAKSSKASSGTATSNPVEKSGTAAGGSTMSLAERQEAYRAKAKKAAGELGDQMFSDALDNLGKNEKSNKGQKAGAGSSKGGSGAAGGSAGGKAAAGSGEADSTGGGGGGGGTSSTSSSGSSDGADGGIGGLSGMELVQAVMLSAAAEASKSAQDLAKQVQSNTAQKNALREQMAPMRDALAQANTTSMTPEQKTQNAQMSDLQDKMDAIGDDNQILFIKLQNATQQYSSMLQACSNVSKTLFDIDKAVVGNIGH